jgi:hypothetical protein
MPETRLTNAGFLSNNEAARDRKRTEDFVRSLVKAKESESKDNSIADRENGDQRKKERNISITPEFWDSKKGLIVRAIVMNRAYNKDAILKATELNDEDYRQAATELFNAKLLMEKSGSGLWVSRELYWQCRSFFQQNQEKEKGALAPSTHTEKVKTAEDHITKEEFLLQFFGSFGRDLGDPERWFTDNPTDLFPFIEECAENKAPAFISVQPVKDKAQPLGIEKVFFDFDYCKNSEMLSESETQRRNAELKEEVKYFLKQLDSLNVKPLVVKTRRGYHVHVFFDSVYELNQDHEFWKQVYKELQVGLLQDHDYRFIDYAVVGDINRMCRIPFSVHEKSGEECPVVDSRLEQDKVRSIEYFKLYGLKQKDILSAMDKAREYRKALKEKKLKYVARTLNFESSDGIKPCFVRAMNSGEMCHQQRLALLQEAYALGFHSPESIVDLFRCLNDFNDSITSYQVNWFFTNKVDRNEVRPYSCRTIQKYGWCLGDECPKLRITDSK